MIFHDPPKLDDLRQTFYRKVVGDHSPGFPASSVDLGWLQRRIKDAWPSFDGSAHDLAAVVSSELSRVVQRVKSFDVHVQESGRHLQVSFTAKDDLGYYDYGFTVYLAPREQDALPVPKDPEWGDVLPPPKPDDESTGRFEIVDQKIEPFPEPRPLEIAYTRMDQECSKAIREAAEAVESKSTHYEDFDLWLAEAKRRKAEGHKLLSADVPGIGFCDETDGSYHDIALWRVKGALTDRSDLEWLKSPGGRGDWFRGGDQTPWGDRFWVKDPDRPGVEVPLGHIMNWTSHEDKPGSAREVLPTPPRHCREAHPMDDAPDPAENALREEVARLRTLVGYVWKDGYNLGRGLGRFEGDVDGAWDKSIARRFLEETKP